MHQICMFADNILYCREVRTCESNNQFLFQLFSTLFSMSAQCPTVEKLLTEG